MNTDIRLLVSFKNHRKRKRLKMALGPGSTDYIIDLWLTAAEDRPDGVLHGWDEVDISLAAGWEEEPKRLLDALIECKFIDLDEGKNCYVLHDWQDHQAWASGAKARSEAAKKAAAARWDKKLKKQRDSADAIRSDADSNADAMRTHQNRNAPSPSPLPSPYPLPSPSRKESDPIGSLSGKPDDDTPPCPKNQIPYKEIVAYLNDKAGCRFKTGSATKGVIRARFNDGYTLEDFKAVIDVKCSQWLTDEKMCAFLRPDTLFRPTKFEAYLAEAHRATAGNGKLEKYRAARKVLRFEGTECFIEHCAKMGITPEEVNAWIISG